MNSFSSAEIDIYRDKYIEMAKSKGLETYDEKYKELLKNKLWTTEQENQINEYKSFIESLKISKSKLTTKKDKLAIDKEIINYESKLYNLIIEKESLIGFTAEKFCNKKVNEYYIFNSLYSDKYLKNLLFTQDEFEEIEQAELDKITKIYNDKISVFDQHNLKCIALMPFFINTIIISDDNPYYFYGKPVMELSYYQIDLFTYGKQFKNILQNSKIQPPPEIMHDPNKLLEWFESSQKAQEIVEKDNTPSDPTKETMITATSIVGVDSEEYKRLGLESNRRLTDEIKKHGGELSAIDLMKIQ